MKEITDPERVEKLEGEAQDLGDADSRKSFAKIEDDKWYRMKVVAVNRGTYRTSSAYHEEGDDYVEIEGEEQLIRTNKGIVWAEQLYDFVSKLSLPQAVAFKKYPKPGTRYKVVKVKVL